MIIAKIPNIKIEPNAIILTETKIYDQEYTNYNNSKYDINSTITTKEKTEFSRNSQRRMKRAFNLLYAISKKQTVFDPITEKKVTFTLNMITLKLSAKQGIYNDKEIKYKLLNDFLTRMRTNQNLKDYLWRCEPQVNGNIHFHIITNKYINYQKIRDTWNQCQKKLGYIDLFNEKHHHINPNSTDIHSIQKIHNAGAYVRKYINKMLEKSITGKFDTSINSRIIGTVIFEEFNINAKECKINCRYITETGKTIQVKAKSTGYLETIEEGIYRWQGNFVFKYEGKEYNFKYLTAVIKNFRPIVGKLWDCSMNLKSSFKCLIHCYPSLLENYNTIIETFKNEIISKEQYEFIPTNHETLIKTLPPLLKFSYLRYLLNIKNHNKPPKQYKKTEKIHTPIAIPLNNNQKLKEIQNNKRLETAKLWSTQTKLF